MISVTIRKVKETKNFVKYEAPQGGSVIVTAYLPKVDEMPDEILVTFDSFRSSSSSPRQEV